MKTMNEVFALLNQEFTDKKIAYKEMSQFCYKYNLEFYHGETRYCIVGKEWDSVIKISRLGYVTDDYNAIEFNNYKAACLLGIERIFLKMWKLGTLDCGLDIYAQTRYSNAHSQMNFQQTEKMRRQTQAIRKCKVFHKSQNNVYCGYRISQYWYARAYQIYGKKFMRKFERFTVENSIGDLHNNNIGYLGKMPIILDFAGYHE